MDPLTIALIGIGAIVGGVAAWKKYSNKDSPRGSKASGGSTSTGTYIQPTSNPGGNNNVGEAPPPPQLDPQASASPPSASRVQGFQGGEESAQEAATTQSTTTTGSTRKRSTTLKEKKKEGEKNRTATIVIIVGMSLLLILSPIMLVTISIFGAGALLTGGMTANMCSVAQQTYSGAQGDLTSAFKQNAGQEQIARLIYDTAIDMDMGENGALVAVYTGLAETNLTNNMEDGKTQPGATFRGIYQQSEDWAGDTAWSGQRPPPDISPGYYFDRTNAWGPNGWAEYDRRMDPKLATKWFLNSLRTRIKEKGMTVQQFNSRQLTDQEMFDWAYSVQRFSLDPKYDFGPYDEIQPRARALLNQVISNPGISGQYDVIDAVYTIGSGGIVRPINAPLGTPYGQVGPAWSSGAHTGSDYPAPKGTPVYAAAGGVVTFAGKTGGTYEGGYGPYGNMVKIETPGPNNGVIELRYAHLSEVKVAKGQKISAGQLVGAVGNTGNVLPRGAGWHLHFEVLFDGVNTDPEKWLSDNTAGSNTGVSPILQPVFIVGDSLTVGVEIGNSLKKEMSGIEYDTVAEEGKSISWGVDVLTEDPLAGLANTWIVALGTNDTGGSNATEEYFAGKIDEVMTLAGGRNVVWINIYVAGRPEATAAMNNALNAATQRYRTLRVVDYAGLLQNNIEFLESDGIHLDANGYRWRASLYAQGLAGLNPNITSGAQADCDEALGANAQGLVDIAQYGAAPATNPYADLAVRYALAQLGKPYSYSANPPYSWDCSKLTAAAWEKAGVPGLTAYTYDQVNEVDALPGGSDLSIVRQSLQPGDLLFYFELGAHHVSMYIGNDKMVHAANPGDGVVITSIDENWYAQRFSSAGRPRIPV